jgi:MurE/MurF fusion protein
MAQRLSLTSPTAAAEWLTLHCSGTLRTDSRRVQPGDAFIAWPGYATDGRRHVGAALAAGASACVVEAVGAEAFAFDDARVATLAALKEQTGEVADLFFGAPSDRLALLAVTGTNGKTSSAWWLAQALSSLGRRCGVIGTLGVGEPPGAVVSTGLTTPDPVTLQAALRDFADAGFSACAIEASSIGIAEHRLAGTRVHIALLTNFTRDHLDYHGSMAAYWSAKRRLFDWPGLRAAVVNVDDEHGALLAQELAGGGLDLWAVSATGPARLSAKNIGYVGGGLAFDLHEGQAQVPVRSRLIGDYNVHNLLGVIGGLRALGVPLVDAAAAVHGLLPVPGRMQRVVLNAPIAAGALSAAHTAGAPEVVVDYAHTPDALEKVLQSLRPLAAARGGLLWCVFGCGGDRDASKRPLMGAIAARLAQRVVITSDNPRSESAAAILEQIAAGIQPQKFASDGAIDCLQIIEDRRAAIGFALRAAANDDVIVIAGKGHETTQEIAGVKHPFSDADEAQRAWGQSR